MALFFYMKYNTNHHWCFERNTHGRVIYCDDHLLYKCHFLDGFRLRLRDLMEPNTLLPKSLSDRERWRGIRGGGDGEKEGEERGEREWQLPSRL